MYNTVIALGAVDQQNIRETFPSVGKELALMAPEVGILVQYRVGMVMLVELQMASPHVTGVAALVLEVNPDLSNVQIRNILNESATEMGNPFIMKRIS